MTVYAMTASVPFQWQRLGYYQTHMLIHTNVYHVKAIIAEMHF